MFKPACRDKRRPSDQMAARRRCSGDYEAYVLDDDGAFDFDQPAEIPEDMRVPPGL